MAYYFPSLKLAYHACLPPNPLSSTIFWFEALAVCAAINHAADVWSCDFQPKLQRLVVYTDSMNTVDMFNTLHALPSHNPLLISSINARSCTSLDVRVCHVPGEKNIIADAILHHNFELATQLVPNLAIYPFTPPQDALGEPSQ